MRRFLPARDGVHTEAPAWVRVRVRVSVTCDIKPRYCERECECVSVCVFERVTVCGSESERVCECVCFNVYACVRVCIRVSACASGAGLPTTCNRCCAVCVCVCVCVCVRERERECE